MKQKCSSHIVASFHNIFHGSMKKSTVAWKKVALFMFSFAL